MMIKMAGVLFIYWMVVTFLFQTSHCYCPLPTTGGSSGDGSEVTLRLYKCHKPSANSPRSCGALRAEYKLQKGVPFALSYTTNGYKVVAKYYGSQTCVSWRRLDRTSSYHTATKVNYKCESICFDSYTYGTYLMDGNCGEFGSCFWIFESIKFEAIQADTVIGNQCPITEIGKGGDRSSTN